MSEEDFFFEEDEEPTPNAEDSSAKSAVTKSSPSKASTAEQQSTGASVSLTIAILIGVIGLLTGMVLGLYINRLATGGTTSSAGSSTTAPPALTQDQLNGDMPSGHPSVGATGDATGGSSTSGISQ